VFSYFQFSPVYGTGMAESNAVSTEFVFSRRGKRLLHYRQHLILTAQFYATTDDDGVVIKDG